jgi:imidazole glycerol-phosphate synthase subunit HisH
LIAIVDYGLGNLGSIINMCKKLGFPATICTDPSKLSAATKLILPGVGAFGLGMQNLRERGFVTPLEELVLGKRIPILGICLGMQLMTQSSEEGGGAGLGWFAARTVRFRFEGPDAKILKVPHMGWNQVHRAKPSRLFAEMFDEPRFYFVHSFHVMCDNATDVLARTHHGYDFVSAIERDNMFGIQSHPEKSHKFGLRLMRNFLGGVEIDVQTTSPCVA